MNHGNKQNHLGRKEGHRKALISNMASSLILHKRIKTTVPKAKVLRKYVEPLITKAKTDTTHSRRNAFSFLGNKEPVKVLFSEVVPRVGERPGGYTRIIRLDNRLGDNAEMCIMELVDFNEIYSTTKGEATKTRTRRSGGKKKTDSKAATEPKSKGAKPKAAKTEEGDNKASETQPDAE
ncbi:MAG: 50S ribosomal protein L17 [Bacteroidota bacterium]|nr:50S ribosomal protein L17 [Bacteroidota bacterium]